MRSGNVSLILTSVILSLSIGACSTAPKIAKSTSSTTSSTNRKVANEGGGSTGDNAVNPDNHPNDAFPPNAQSPKYYYDVNIEDDASYTIYDNLCVSFEETGEWTHASPEFALRFTFLPWSDSSLKKTILVKNTPWTAIIHDVREKLCFPLHDNEIKAGQYSVGVEILINGNTNPRARKSWQLLNIYPIQSE